MEQHYEEPQEWWSPHRSPEADANDTLSRPKPFSIDALFAPTTDIFSPEPPTQAPSLDHVPISPTLNTLVDRLTHEPSNFDIKTPAPKLDLQRQLAGLELSNPDLTEWLNNPIGSNGSARANVDALTTPFQMIGQERWSDISAAGENAANPYASAARNATRDLDPATPEQPSFSRTFWSSVGTTFANGVMTWLFPPYPLFLKFGEFIYNPRNWRRSLIGLGVSLLTGAAADAIGGFSQAVDFTPIEADCVPYDLSSACDTDPNVATPVVQDTEVSTDVSTEGSHHTEIDDDDSLGIVVAETGADLVIEIVDSSTQKSEEENPEEEPEPTTIRI